MPSLGNIYYAIYHSLDKMICIMECFRQVVAAVMIFQTCLQGIFFHYWCQCFLFCFFWPEVRMTWPTWDETIKARRLAEQFCCKARKFYTPDHNTATSLSCVKHLNYFIKVWLHKCSAARSLQTNPRRKFCISWLGKYSRIELIESAIEKSIKIEIL